jgi:hypothetical protein
VLRIESYFDDVSETYGSDHWTLLNVLPQVIQESRIVLIGLPRVVKALRPDRSDFFRSARKKRAEQNASIIVAPIRTRGKGEGGRAGQLLRCTSM